MKYEFGKKFLIKPQMTKTSQDNNLNYINFSKHFNEYHTEKLILQGHNMLHVLS